MAEPESKKIEDDELPELELSLKKKKKKKASPKLDDEETSIPPSELSSQVAAAVETTADGDGEEPFLDLSKKKKKKKKKEDTGADEEVSAGTTTGETETEPSQNEPIAPKKKSKEKKSPLDEPSASSAAAAGGTFGVNKDEDGADGAADDGPDEQLEDRDVEIDIDEESDGEETKEIEEFDEAAWQKTDRDYHYNEILHRMYSQLRAKNPELSGGRKKYKMKVPQVLRDGSKKTVFANFQAICDSLNRNHEHLLNFVLVELGTSGSLDASNRLTIKGRYPPKHIENLIRRYVTEYVICGMCKSLDTVLERDPNTRLYVLKCSNCRATRTVTAVKQGFLAQIGKRPKT